MIISSSHTIFAINTPLPFLGDFFACCYLFQNNGRSKRHIAKCWSVVLHYEQINTTALCLSISGLSPSLSLSLRAHMRVFVNFFFMTGLVIMYYVLCMTYLCIILTQWLLNGHSGETIYTGESFCILDTVSIYYLNRL